MTSERRVAENFVGSTIARISLRRGFEETISDDTASNDGRALVQSRLDDTGIILMRKTIFMKVRMSLPAASLRYKHLNVSA
jgi:hypothetical protein